MATTISRTAIRQEILRRLPTLGRVLSADSITKAGPAIVQVSEYERQRAGVTSYEGQYVYRYNLSDPDRWRRITTVDTTTGTISVDGPAYVNNSDLAYERLGVHPDVINGFIAEAQRRQRVRTNIALVGNGTHDYDMELSGVQYWDGSLGGSLALNTNLVKITTDVRTGTQALQATTTNASNVFWGEACRVTPGVLTYMGVLIRATTLTGELTFGMQDAGTTTVLASQTISGIGAGDWVYTFVQIAAGANTTTVHPYFQTNNSGDVYIVDTIFGPYQTGQTDFTLQSGINEMYKLRYVRPVQFRMPLTTANFFSGEAMVYVGDLTQPENFTVEAFYRDAVSNRLRLIPSTYYPDPISSPGYGSSYGGPFYPPPSATMRPIMLAMEAQVSDFEPLLTETSTTSQPMDLVVGYSIRLLAEYVNGRSPTPYWAGVLDEYKKYAAIEDDYRPPQPMMPQQRYHLIRA